MFSFLLFEDLSSLSNVGLFDFLQRFVIFESRIFLVQIIFRRRSFVTYVHHQVESVFVVRGRQKRTVFDV